jgi:hypothetical protein
VDLYEKDIDIQQMNCDLIRQHSTSLNRMVVEPNMVAGYSARDGVEEKIDELPYGERVVEGAYRRQYCDLIYRFAEIATLCCYPQLRKIAEQRLDIRLGALKALSVEAQLTSQPDLVPVSIDGVNQ